MTTEAFHAGAFHDPRMKGFRTRASVEETRDLIDARVLALESYSCLLEDAYRGVLADRVTSTVDVPPFDRAAMDGYALRGEETFGSGGFAPATFRVIGRSRPGRPYSGEVVPGTAVEIATGAPMPSGADAVVPVEDTRRIDSAVLVLEAVPPGRHVGHKGEDIATGRIVFKPGRVLRPQDLGVLSALGVAHVSVVRKPIVTVMVTGDELLEPGTPSRDFCIPDMNSPMLSALITRDGGIPLVIGPLPDDREIIRAEISYAAITSDAVLISGGSSTGPEDYAPSILAEIGELPIHGVAIRPSSPFGLGFVGKIPVALMPGNPVSCLCAYDFFAGRIIRGLAGNSREMPYRSMVLPLGEKLVSILGRVDYARVLIQSGTVKPMTTSGASILTSTTRADGFVIVPSALEGWPAGSLVKVYLYEG